ncbi:MAG TPA: alpha/beta hydrolase [Phenylobacterium sp.]|nr:alpha/beta hydrolase [Phenylobacterium sp.]
MVAAVADAQPRIRRIPLPDRGGETSALEFGPQDQPIDIVFAHANGFNARTYRTILAPLAKDFRILALDQRGHGRSGLPPIEGPGRVSWDDVADDLLAIVEALDARDIVLAGHSMGGTCSLLCAAAAPQRVRGLALFDPVVMPPELVAQSRAGKMTASPLVQGALRRRAVFPSRAAVIEAYTGRGAFRSWPPEMLADYVADGFRDTLDGQVELTCSPAWEASNFTAHDHDPWAAFAAIQAPIRILRAEDGSTCRIEGHEAELTASGRVRIETVPGTSHFLPMERPDLVRQVLTEMAGR